MHKKVYHNPLEKSLDKVIASGNHLRISVRKMQLAADLIRNCTAQNACERLAFQPKKSCQLLLKVMKSAIANGTQKGMLLNELKVNDIFVGRGPKIRRFIARAKGRGDRIEKSLTNVTIILRKHEKKEVLSGS
jgi:large subunit ribosomal protein L22